MKHILFLGLVLLGLLVACTRLAEPTNTSARIEALEKQLVEMKPGFGEVMSVVQQHHAKLFFSGHQGNWELAQYQLDEIKEGLEDLTKYYPTFKDVKLPIKELIPTMMTEPLNQVQAAIQKKDKKQFNSAFNGLTKSCNGCHQAAEHGFVVIQTPSNQEFTNQKFSP